jgi:cytochrome oxidase Cu insertion factor (SCO1/SenC/PrrC family)
VISRKNSSSEKKGTVVKTWIAAAIVLAGLAPSTRAQEFAPGAPVSAFIVRDMGGQLQNFPSLKGKVTVVMFFSTRCPMSNAI